MRLLLATCAVVTLGLATTSPARGNSPERNLADSLPIARAAWPDSPCRDHEVVEITSSLSQLNATAEAQLDGSCHVSIRAIHDPYKFCATLVHEFGHLTEYLDGNGHPALPDGRPVDGQGHTNDGSIMDPGAPYYDACEALGPPVTARAAAADTFDLPASACVLASVTSRGRLYRCGRKRHVLVVLDRRGYVDYVTDQPAGHSHRPRNR